MARTTVRKAIRDSLMLLCRRDRLLLGLAVGTQMATSLLDLVGVFLIGTVGALAVATVGGQRPPESISAVVSKFGLSGLSDDSLVVTLAGAAALFLLAKSALSPLLMSRVFEFLAKRQVSISGRLTGELLSRPLTFVHRRSSQQTAAALLQGVGTAIVVILGQMVVAASEITLLAVLTAALFLVSPTVAIGAVIYFALVGFGLQKLLGWRAARLGHQRFVADIASLRAVQEAIGTYRELTVSDRRPLYVERIRNLRATEAHASARLQVFAVLPKYVSEGALILGAFALAGALFATREPVVAAGTFALFLATATRVMPSLLRFQAAAIAIQVGTALASSTVDLFKDLSLSPDCDDAKLGATADKDGSRWLPSSVHGDFVPEILLSEVGFRYPEASEDALSHVGFAVSGGQSAALIGRSGAGKSTLADVILGVLEPTSGAVTVGGVPPVEAVRRWPGCIAYVPQDVMLVDDSIRANVALGIPAEFVDDDLVWEALSTAQLDDYVRRQPDGLATEVGEKGLRLSGGQRQRVGIARALYTRPRLLVLDEATSSLDAETEKTVTEMLENLQEHVTTVVVAHRLSTVRHADLVVYLDHGRVLAQGTFDEVCAAVPALRHQAHLMGILPQKDAYDLLQ